MKNVKMKQKPHKNLPGLTLIEMLIAVALISMLLTALALVLLQSSRTIQEAQTKSTAVNQAQSCLDNFRNLRDSNTWTAFCAKVKTSFYNATSTNATSTIVFTKDSSSMTICPAVAGNSYTLNITECHDEADKEKATVEVKVSYQNFSGGTGTTTATQNFEKTSTESDYIF